MQPQPKRVRVHVIRVDFNSEDGIPIDAQEEIASELQSNLIEPEADRPYLKDLANGIGEVGVRGALRNRGYFTASATAKLTVLRSEGADISVVVTINATPGPQYRTGDVSSPQTPTVRSRCRLKLCERSSRFRRATCSMSKEFGRVWTISGDLICERVTWI
jgi:hypothetical protein